jgi:hypothetical protein
MQASAALLVTAEVDGVDGAEPAVVDELVELFELFEHAAATTITATMPNAAVFDQRATGAPLFLWPIVPRGLRGGGCGAGHRIVG